MPRRDLDFDMDDLRRTAYKDLNDDTAEEAIWEAFESLSEQGVNIGPKARAILNKRQKIKQKLPKF